MQRQLQCILGAIPWYVKDLTEHIVTSIFANLVLEDHFAGGACATYGECDMGQKSSKASQIEPRYLAPQKLYCYSEVDLKKLRKLIKDRKLAPCFPGLDSDSREVSLGKSIRRPTRPSILSHSDHGAVGRLPYLLPELSQPKPRSLLP